jgi:hypothetical protein
MSTPLLPGAGVEGRCRRPFGLVPPRRQPSTASRQPFTSEACGRDCGTPGKDRFVRAKGRAARLPVAGGQCGPRRAGHPHQGDKGEDRDQQPAGWRRRAVNPGPLPGCPGWMDQPVLCSLLLASSAACVVLTGAAGRHRNGCVDGTVRPIPLSRGACAHHVARPVRPLLVTVAVWCPGTLVVLPAPPAYSDDHCQADAGPGHDTTRYQSADMIMLIPCLSCTP